MDLEFPAEMIERAAKALADDTGAGYIFVGRYSAKEAEREVYRKQARAVLTAALEGCEIREEWGASTGDYTTTSPLTRSQAQREVDAANNHSRTRGNTPRTVLVRRTVIKTAAGVVEEADQSRRADCEDGWHYASEQPTDACPTCEEPVPWQPILRESSEEAAG